MGEKSAISWTDSTWNVVTGCSKVSPGCANCYAESLSLRMGWSQKPWTPENAAENVVVHRDRLVLPLRWKRPRMVFVNSMSDVFHELLDESLIDDMFAVMVVARHHIFQVLTKRPERMRDYMNAPDRLERWAVAAQRLVRQGVMKPTDRFPLAFPPTNIWLGTSVENQRWAKSRIDALAETKAVCRFLSCEPLLGPLDLSRWLGLFRGEDGWGVGPGPGPRALHWVIVGGESGPGYREMQPEWATDIRDQCREAGVAFFFKQSSGLRPGKGTLLDGREYHEFPEQTKLVMGDPELVQAIMSDTEEEVTTKP